MEKKHVLLVLLKKRKSTAVNVQKVLTDWGCLIKTRLGIHDGVLNHCSETGLIILELVGTDKQKKDLAKKLTVIPGVDTKLVELTVK
jgi:hypothetical protein